MRDLFARFVDSGQANEAADDIGRGDDLLRRWPAPEPSDELLTQIKGQMADRLVRSGRRHVRWFASRAAGIAAALVIVASVWTGLNREHGSVPKDRVFASLIPTAIWRRALALRLLRNWQTFRIRVSCLRVDRPFGRTCLLRCTCGRLFRRLCRLGLRRRRERRQSSKMLPYSQRRGCSCRESLSGR